MMAVIVAVALGIWVSPAVAGKVALTDTDLDQVSAGGGPTIIESGGNVTNNDDSQFNLNFDVPEAQIGFRALAIQNVVGELQLLVNLNVLSANANVNSTDQRNFSLQSWGGTLPIPDTGIKAEVAGVTSAAPCSVAGSCTTSGGSGGSVGAITTGTGGTAAAQTGGSGSPGGISSPATALGGIGGIGGVGSTGSSSGAATGGAPDLSACTSSCTGVGGNATTGAGGNGGNGGNGGRSGAAVAITGNGGNGGNGGNAAAAPGGAGGSVTAPAGNGAEGGNLTVSGSASSSPGVVAISPTASASGDLIIRTTGAGATVDNVDNSQFNLTFTETHAQSDLAALFISNVVGRSQMALNLNIASSKFTTVPFEANAIAGDVTGTIKQVNTGIQFRGTPLVGATGVTAGINMTINHQNQ